MVKIRIKHGLEKWYFCSVVCNSAWAKKCSNTIFTMTKKKIIIIGGGAAGFFCAANLDETKYETTILEQNSEVLQKVKVSGGGRCNVTHACYDPRELVQFYPRGHKELRSVFHKFQPADMLDWLEQRGVETHTEEDGRIFPVSDSSQTIIDVLLQEVRQKGFIIHTKQTVTAINPTGDGYEVTTTGATYAADIVVYATGSAPKSVRLLEALGHQLIPAVPSLFTFNIKNKALNDLMGTSFPEAEVRIPSLRASDSGPLLITHWGLSGPAVLKLSAWKARELAVLQYQFEIIVNFVGTDLETAEQRWLAYRQQHPKKTVGKSKLFDLTNRFWNYVLQEAKIHPDKIISDMSAAERQALLTLLTAHRMQVNGKSTFKEEFVTAGGVSLKEIDFRTMQSRVLPDFYMAGEVLDIDAVTGGFNFQACWSEAWLIAQDLNSKSSEH